MRNLTYETYLVDDSVRERIERDARRARNEALWLHFFAPIARFCGRLLALRGVRPRAAAKLAA